jgi:hypothetical protein
VCDDSFDRCSQRGAALDEFTINDFDITDADLADSRRDRAVTA